MKQLVILSVLVLFVAGPCAFAKDASCVQDVRLYSQVERVGETVKTIPPQRLGLQSIPGAEIIDSVFGKVFYIEYVVYRSNTRQLEYLYSRLGKVSEERAKQLVGDVSGQVFFCKKTKAKGDRKFKLSPVEPERSSETSKGAE